MKTTTLRIPKRVPTILLIVALVISWKFCARGASLADFGYRHVADNSLGTLSHRPLLAILVEFDTTPPLRLGHSTNYYDTLFFGFAASNTVNGFYSENSNGRFFWSRGGILSLSLSANETLAAMGDLSRFYSNIVAKAMMSRFNFQGYDANSNNIVSQDELQIVIVRADAPGDGNNRSFGLVRPPGFTYSVSGIAVQVGHLTGLSTICHELGHALQAPFVWDLYGVWNQECVSDHLTIMSCTSEDAAWHFDPWHKMQFGWCEPRIQSLRAGGVATIPAAQLRDPTAPIILYDPSAGTNEFFMLEYRNTNSPSGPGYDAKVAAAGLVVWRVKQDAGHNPALAPRFDAGPIPAQNLWRFCEKCKGLHYISNDGSPTLGPCPEIGQHSRENSSAYLVVNNIASAPGQHGWRWCRKCQGMFFGPGESVSRCPASGTHDGSQSGDYSFVQDDPDAPGQKGWRWCRKCQGMFYGPNVSQSDCPADNTRHDGSESGDYSMLLEGMNEAVWSLGAPVFGHGRGTNWGSGVTTPYLRWIDGSETRTRLHVRPFVTDTGSITMEWWAEEETWVDFNHSGFEFGTFDFPFDTFEEGVTNVPWGGTLKIKSGSSSERRSVASRMTIQAYGGPVTIGR